MKSLKEKFFSKVQIANTGCWLWMGSKFKLRGNYGLISHDKKARRAHRVSWEIHFGEIPEGMVILHKCDTPVCVNPEHLSVGTQLQNIQDMKQKGRSKGVPGNRHYNPKLSERDIPVIRRLRKEGKTQQYIANIFGVSQRLIGKIDRNEYWRNAQ